MGGTGTNTGYLHTQGHGSSCFYYISPSYTMALLLMTLRVGYEQRERRRRDSFYVVFAFEIGFVGGCSVRVFERSFEGAAPLTVAAPT